jgi:hypothetical protein
MGGVAQDFRNAEHRKERNYAGPFLGAFLMFKQIVETITISSSRFL